MAETTSDFDVGVYLSAMPQITFQQYIYRRHCRFFTENKVINLSNEDNKYTTIIDFEDGEVNVIQNIYLDIPNINNIARLHFYFKKIDNTLNSELPEKWDIFDYPIIFLKKINETNNTLYKIPYISAYLIVNLIKKLNYNLILDLYKSDESDNQVIKILVNNDKILDTDEINKFSNSDRENLINTVTASEHELIEGDNIINICRNNNKKVRAIFIIQKEETQTINGELQLIESSINFIQKQQINCYNTKNNMVFINPSHNNNLNGNIIDITKTDCINNGYYALNDQSKIILTVNKPGNIYIILVPYDVIRYEQTPRYLFLCSKFSNQIRHYNNTPILDQEEQEEQQEEETGIVNDESEMYSILNIYFNTTFTRIKQNIYNIFEESIMYVGDIIHNFIKGVANIINNIGSYIYDKYIIIGIMIRSVIINIMFLAIKNKITTEECVVMQEPILPNALYFECIQCKKVISLYTYKKLIHTTNNTCPYCRYSLRQPQLYINSNRRIIFSSQKIIEDNKS